MAGGRIAGITIEISADASKFQSSMSKLDKSLKTTQNNLRDINKLLKLDPKNTELLTQKQKNLEKAIQTTKQRLTELKNEQANIKKGTEEWDALQREIIETEQKLKGLQKEFKEFGSVAKQQMIAAGKQMQELGGKITEAGRKFMPVSAAAGAVVTGLGAIGYQAVTTADDLNTLSKQTGFTTEELQKMYYASDMIDVSVDDIKGALRKLKPKIDENNSALKDLGVEVLNADGSLRSANDVFFDTIEALSHIANETERDQKSMEIFGKGADSLAGIIDDGGKALREYSEEAERLGLILGQDTLDRINAVNDKLDESKAKWNAAKLALGAVVAEALAPLISNLALIVEKLAQWMAKLTPEQARFVIIVAATVAAIAPLLLIIGGLVSAIGTLTTLFAGIGAVIAGAIGPILAIIAAIALVIVAIKKWDTIVAFVKGLWKRITEEWHEGIEKTKEDFDRFVENFTKKLNDLKTRTVTKFNEIKTSVTTKTNEIKNNVSTAWNSITSTIVSKAEQMKNGVAAAMEAAKYLVSQTVQNLKAAMNFEWSLPHLKLPHIHVTGGVAPYGIGGKGSLPRFSIDWYKKAYDNAVMFTSPTVLGTPSGAKGFGDGNGAEIVLGLNKLRELVGTSGGVVINVYASPDMNINQLADKIQDRFVQLQKQRSAAYA